MAYRRWAPDRRGTSLETVLARDAVDPRQPGHGHVRPPRAVAVPRTAGHLGDYRPRHPRRRRWAARSVAMDPDRPAPAGRADYRGTRASRLVAHRLAAQAVYWPERPHADL